MKLRSFKIVKTRLFRFKFKTIENRNKLKFKNIIQMESMIDEIGLSVR